MFSVDVADLILYCIQQLGIMLAVGAETVLLVAYGISMRDGKFEDIEARFSRAVRRALMIGMLMIVVSGVAITALHAMLGQAAIISEPAFLFKWLLILLLVGVYIWQRGKVFSHPLIEGFVGGTWYAVFLVHILAPLTSWFNLIGLYAAFLVLFVAAWGAIVKMTLPHLPKMPMPAKKPAPVPETKMIIPGPIPKPVTPSLAPPKIVTPPPPPVIQKPSIPPPPPPPASPKPPADDPHHSPWLPAIHIMPKTQAELDNKSHVMPLGAVARNS